MTRPFPTGDDCEARAEGTPAGTAGGRPAGTAGGTPAGTTGGRRMLPGSSNGGLRGVTVGGTFTGGTLKLLFLFRKSGGGPLVGRGKEKDGLRKFGLGKSFSLGRKSFSPGRKSLLFRGPNTNGSLLGLPPKSLWFLLPSKLPNPTLSPLLPLDSGRTRDRKDSEDDALLNAQGPKLGGGKKSGRSRITGLETGLETGLAAGSG